MSPSDDVIHRILELAIKIQQTPAPPFAEGQRARLVHDLFTRAGLADVSLDSTGNVYARLPGDSPAAWPCLVISAHLDTVFPSGTDLHLSQTSEQISGPGIGDNSLGLASLLGLVWMLEQRGRRLPGDAWLVANVGEEGLGNLRGITSVVDRFGSEALAYVVIEGLGLGEIFHRGLGVQRYRIVVQTPGGHSWIDYGRPSAIHEIARLVNRLSSLPLPVEPRTTLNVGIIGGGTSINTIASQAYLELDLRSTDSEALKKLAGQVESLARRASRNGVSVSTELIGRRPSGEIPLTHWLVRLAEACLQEQGIQPIPGIGSTDANLPLSRNLPAICIGLTHGKGAHTLEETIQTRPLAQGMEQFFQLVSQAWESS